MIKMMCEEKHIRSKMGKRNLARHHKISLWRKIKGKERVED